MTLATDRNRPQPLWQPPPTACLTASGAASEVPSLLMHPCPCPLCTLRAQCDLCTGNPLANYNCVLCTLHTADCAPRAKCTLHFKKAHRARHAVCTPQLTCCAHSTMRTTHCSWCSMHDAHCTAHFASSTHTTQYTHRTAQLCRLCPGQCAFLRNKVAMGLSSSNNAQFGGPVACWTDRDRGQFWFDNISSCAVLSQMGNFQDLFWVCSMHVGQCPWVFVP